MQENNIIIYTLVGLCALAPLFLSFSLYGQDGYHLWFPILSEYLKGDQIYHSSAVIFNGQDLGGIYGELPFWKLFRLLNFSLPNFLNYTHVIFCLTLFSFFLSIHKGLKEKTGPIDIIILFMMATLSPVITNRMMAGHLNLLFGVLPFFGFLALIFNRSKKNLFLVFLANWFALSTQDYQILTYYVFYIPILATLFFKYVHDKNKFLLLFTFSLTAAFLINYPQFLRMLEHARSINNARSLNESVVYSYLTSNWLDSFDLFFSSTTHLFVHRPFGFFHETNYGMGLFLILFGMFASQKRLVATTYITILFLFLFCSDAIGFHYLSELPLIKAFRVPQRAFMILALFLPLWTFCSYQTKWNKNLSFVFFALLILAQLFSGIELFVLIALLISYLIFKSQSDSDKFYSISMLFCIISIFSDIGTRFKFSPEMQLQFDIVSKMLEPVTKRFSTAELRQHTYHFESPHAFTLNYVAQTLGMRTLEGYGHPPTNLISVFENITKLDIPPNGNTLYFSGDVPNKDMLMKAFGINYVVSFEKNNTATISKTNY